MTYTSLYFSPLGAISITCDNEAITGLWFTGQNLFENAQTGLNENFAPIEFIESSQADNKGKNHPLLGDASRWLDVYFAGHKPNFLPPLKYGCTSFRRRVYNILLTIPYGETMTYGQIANIIAKEQCIKKMSAQAVGGAVGHNPISIMIPCHRVVGVNGNLTGYAGGLERKIQLLDLESQKTLG